MPQARASLIEKLLRFACVGVVVTGSYSAVTYAGVEWLGYAPTPASIAGWAVACVVSYLGQKYFTFRSDNQHRIEAPKFAAACGLALIVSLGSMVAVTTAQLDYRLGILITALILPLCNFTVMNLWVFARRHAAPARLKRGDA